MPRRRFATREAIRPYREQHLLTSSEDDDWQILHHKEPVTNCAASQPQVQEDANGYGDPSSNEGESENHCALVSTDSSASDDSGDLGTDTSSSPAVIEERHERYIDEEDGPDVLEDNVIDFEQDDRDASTAVDLTGHWKGIYHSHALEDQVIKVQYSNVFLTV